VPKIRELIQDYDKSMQEMKVEEQKFKQQFKLEYSAIFNNTIIINDNFTHDSRDVEEIVRLNSCLKS
jgi:hypothetical protein